ncbi:MAG: hypothetical protein JNN15_00435 [Blastocatellia bacterium]|nr:hypothetical protein [Blastocatellia bacterium]
MSKKHSPADTFQQAQKIKDAWSSIDPEAVYGTITLADFEKAIAELGVSEAEINRLLDQLSGARARHEEQRYRVWDLVKRTRSGVKANYGDDSNEYKRFGGTKLSERNYKK